MERDWVKTDYFCPHCGDNMVLEEDDAGDYYVGCWYTCEACFGKWTMQV